MAKKNARKLTTSSKHSLESAPQGKDCSVPSVSPVFQGVYPAWNLKTADDLCEFSKKNGADKVLILSAFLFPDFLSLIYLTCLFVFFFVSVFVLSHVVSV